MLDFDIGRRRFFFVLANEIVMQVAIFITNNHTETAVGITAENFIGVNQFSEMIIVFHQVIQLTSGHRHLRSIIQFVNDVFHNYEFGAHRTKIICVNLS